MEKLPGSVKSKWCLNFKHKMDIAIEDALKLEVKQQKEGSTKNRFVGVDTWTNSGLWKQDKQWFNKANPFVKDYEEKREHYNMRLIAAKHKQKQIQYMSLEQQYGLQVKLKQRRDSVA